MNSNWILAYSEEGYPYYYNELTNESKWADFPENNLPNISLSQSNSLIQLEDEEDIDEIEFDAFLQSSIGIEVFEEELEYIERKVDRRMKNLQRQRDNDDYSDSDSSSDDSLLSEDSLSSSDSDVQLMLEPVIPELNKDIMSFKGFLSCIYDLSKNFILNISHLASLTRLNFNCDATNMIRFVRWDFSRSIWQHIDNFMLFLVEGSRDVQSNDNKEVVSMKRDE